MRSPEELRELAAPLKLQLTLDEKVLLVQFLGLMPAFCPDCLCTIGSPVCHPIPIVITGDNEPQRVDHCPPGCRANEDDDDDE